MAAPRSEDDSSNNQILSKFRAARSSSSAASSAGGMVPDHDHLFKIVLGGDSGVGKSCLLLRFVDDTYSDSYISTIGVAFKIKSLDSNGKRVKLQIWDTAGQERSRSITSNNYRGLHACLLVFDLSDQVSFNNLKQHIAEIRVYGEEVKICLVGAKSDLLAKAKYGNTISPDEIASFQKELGGDVPYIEVSAKENENVELLFQAIADILTTRYSDDASASSSSYVSESERRFSDSFKSDYKRFYESQSGGFSWRMFSPMKSLVYDSSSIITREDAKSQADKYPDGTTATVLRAMDIRRS